MSALLPKVIPLPTLSLQEIVALPAAPIERDSDYIISHNRAIVRTLRDIRQRRTELHIRIEVQEQVYIFHSSIQKVEEDHQLLILHQLQPNQWREVITEPVLAEISCFLPTGLLRFETLIAPLEEDDALFCTLQIPEQISKTQQRSSYRVPLTSQDISVELSTALGPISGKIIDFSIEGCCCLFSADLLEQLEEEAAIYQVRFALDSKLVVISDAIICRLQQLPKSPVLIGLKFVSIDPGLKRQLQTALLAIERQQLRRHAGSIRNS